MSSLPRKRLGRGLDALLGDYAPVTIEDTAIERADEGDRKRVPVAFIHPNPRNPRREFASDDLEDLAVSIEKHGLVQPIVVRSMGKPDAYEIIAGERRWRAAQKAGLHEIPISVLDVTDRQALELAIVENVQRTDLNPVEEALGYQALLEEFSYTQADLGDAIGKSRVHVTNMLRLLKLPPPVLAAIRGGQLSAGHGRALVTARNPEALSRTIIAKGLSVRDAEKLAQSTESTKSPQKSRKKPQKDANIAAMETQLGNVLGMGVTIVHDAGGSGDIRIRYRSLDQFDAICKRLGS